MLEQQGRVVSREADGSLWVELDEIEACGSCQSSSSCGKRWFQKSDEQSHKRFWVPAGLPYEVGERVEVRVDETAVLRASMLIYGLPLLLIVASVFLSAWLGLSGAAMYTVFGIFLILAAGSVKTLSSRLSCNPSYHPQVLSLRDRHSRQEVLPARNL